MTWHTTAATLIGAWTVIGTLLTATFRLLAIFWKDTGIPQVEVAPGTKHQIPERVTLFPCAGYCPDDERLNEGAIAVVNPDGIVYPNTAAVFDDGNGLPAMKVYLGISTDEAFARAMKQEGKGPLGVFWMANPENLISLPLVDISIARARCRNDWLRARLCSFEEQAKSVALGMPCIDAVLFNPEQRALLL